MENKNFLLRHCLNFHASCSNSIKTTVSTTSVTLMSSSNWFDFSPLICIYVELWNMLVKGWVQKNDFSTWRIVSYAWSLSTSYYLLILKWKKLKRYCFLVEKVLLFIKKYCRKKVLSKGIRPLDTVYDVSHLSISHL